MGSPCVVLRVSPEGEIVPLLATIDERGGVRAGESVWTPDSTDWGFYTYRNGGAFTKARRLPAIFVPHDSVEPFPIRQPAPKPAKPQDRLRYPPALKTYLDGDFLGRMVRSSRSPTTATALGDWLKRVPRWAWFVALAVAAVAWTILGDNAVFGEIVERVR